MLTLERRLPRNRLLKDIALSPDSGSAIVRPDQTHPFFYDHPLDHVPGLLLIESAFQLARVWADRLDEGARDLTGFSVRFRRFCLHDAPIRLALQVTAWGDLHTLAVAIRQDGGGAADVTLRMGQLAGDGGDAAASFAADPIAASLPWDPAPPARLNKQCRNNVMIAQPARTPYGHAARMLSPSPLNLLAEGHPRLHHPLYLLEAFMQVLRFQNSDRPADAPRMRDILAGIDAEIAAPIARGTPVFVLCSANERAAARFLIRDARLDTPHGTAMRVSVLTSRPEARPILLPANDAVSVPFSEPRQRGHAAAL